VTILVDGVMQVCQPAASGIYRNPSGPVSGIEEKFANMTLQMALVPPQSPSRSEERKVEMPVRAMSSDDAFDFVETSSVVTTETSNFDAQQRAMFQAFMNFYMTQNASKTPRPDK
jgi:hypothetical protein